MHISIPEMAGPRPGLVTTVLRALLVSPAEVPNETAATTSIYPPPGRARRYTVAAARTPFLAPPPPGRARCTGLSFIIISGEHDLRQNSKSFKYIDFEMI